MQLRKHRLGLAAVWLHQLPAALYMFRSFLPREQLTRAHSNAKLSNAKISPNRLSPTCSRLFSEIILNCAGVFTPSPSWKLFPADTFDRGIFVKLFGFVLKYSYFYKSPTASLFAWESIVKPVVQLLTALLHHSMYLVWWRSVARWKHLFNNSWLKTQLVNFVVVQPEGEGILSRIDARRRNKNRRSLRSNKVRPQQ